MSCNYADGLSPYADKGVLGVPEKFEDDESVETKATILCDWISQARHVVVHTGAGISTSAGIPDFRGPRGVWTLEQQGLQPNVNVSFDEAQPTITHMALNKLVETGYVKFIVSQNIDGLHVRSGLNRNRISELHGNIFTERCRDCHKQFVRRNATTSVGQKCLGKSCPGKRSSGRACRGKLSDTILDWEDSLPVDDLNLADFHSNMADLNICLGTTLQIVPSGLLPMYTKRHGGRVVIINLQPTKHDSKADLIVNMFVDVVMMKVMKKLGLEIPQYDSKNDPTKKGANLVIEWTFTPEYVREIQGKYLREKPAKKRKFVEKLKKDETSIKKEKSEEVTVKQEKKPVGVSD